MRAPGPKIPFRDHVGSVAAQFAIWLVMVALIWPPILAWQIWDPLDTYPYWLGLGAGVLISAATVRWGSFLGGWMIGVIVAAPLWTMALGIAINALADRSPAVSHDSSFVGYQHRSKGPSRARFVSWRGAPENQSTRSELLLCDGMFDRGCHLPKPGGAVVVVTHAGALGWEWIERVDPR